MGERRDGRGCEEQLFAAREKRGRWKREGRGGGAHIFSWALLFSFSVSLPSSFVSQPEKREGQRDHPSVQEGEGESKYQYVCRDRVNSAAVELCEKVSRIRAGVQYIRTFYSRANCGPACLYCHILWLYSAAKTCLFALSLFRFSLLPLPYCFSCGKGGGGTLPRGDWSC